MGRFYSTQLFLNVSTSLSKMPILIAFLLGLITGISLGANIGNSPEVQALVVVEEKMEKSQIGFPAAVPSSDSSQAGKLCPSPEPDPDPQPIPSPGPKESG